MRRRWSARSLKYFLLAGKGVANNKHSRCTHVLWLYNDIIEKLDNFKHEWKSGSRATTRTVPVQQTVCTRALAISLFRNFRIAIRYCQSWNGRKTVGQRDTRARARAFEIGGLLYIASKRVCNVVVVRVIQAFRIAVQREHFLSSLVQSFHSRTNLNNTKRSIIYTRIILLLFRLKSFYLRIASRDGEM